MLNMKDWLYNNLKYGNYDSLYLLFRCFGAINPHSCDPNALKVLVDHPNQSPALSLVAAKKIPKGCEINISHLPDYELLLPHDQRQEKLKFVCGCKRCTHKDGCGLIVDCTRLLKCRSCGMGTRVGLVGGSLFGPCSNTKCNRKIKIKNLVNRKDLNGVIATLGAKCESITDGTQGSETERYEVTIKLSNDSIDLETKIPSSKDISANYKSMMI